jgi:hypothetical protein
MNLSGGEWINPGGFILRDTLTKVPGWPPWRKRTLYEYTADECGPMTFHAGHRLFIRPDRHGYTDLGSVPELLQWFGFSKDLHNPSFIMHDSACREHGLYFAYCVLGPYTFCPMSSASAARLLGQCLHAAGYPHRARMIAAAVRRFGPQFGV